MEKHLIDFTWENQKPQFVLRELNSSEVETIDVLDYEMSWEISEKRICPGANKDEPCENQVDLTGTNHERCFQCENKVGFRGVFFFGLDRNKANPAVKRHLDQPHFLYLAFFAPDKIKIGTAAKSRQKIRLLEQGASAYIFIAEKDGWEIQRIEHYLSHHLNISESVPLSFKIKHYGSTVSIDTIREKLNEESELIKKKLKGSEFENWLIPGQKELNTIEIPNYNLIDQNKLLFASYIEKPICISGVIISSRGKLLLSEKKSSYQIISAKDLIGHIVKKIKEDDDTGSESSPQPTLFS